MWEKFRLSEEYPKIFWHAQDLHPLGRGCTGATAVYDAPTLSNGEMFGCMSFEGKGTFFSPDKEYALSCGDIVPPSAPICIHRKDLPDRPEWIDLVHKALDAIAHGPLRKVVLARQTTLVYDRSLSPIYFLYQIYRRISRTSRIFLYQPTPYQCFLGATPEVLYTRQGRRLFSIALAGTRTRGASEKEDLLLAKELLENRKDRREIDWIDLFLQEQLSPLCTTLSFDTHRHILKAGNVQHLSRTCSAILKTAVTDLQLLEALHPTPALGGYPRDEAMKFIGQHEPWNRKWYGAPIGWFSATCADVAVAIRSARIEGNELNLFAGAGIVHGSTPEGEWAELNHKIQMWL